MLVRMLSVLRLALKKTGLLPLVKRVHYRPSGGNAGRSSQSGWKYRLKLLIEQANYAAMEQVHDLPAIHVYWENKHLAPLFRDFGFETLEEFFCQQLAQALRSSTPPTTMVNATNVIVSIGSGNCDFEVALARRLVGAGLDNFRIECMDVNTEMLRRGQALARADGVAPFIVPVQADFNSWTPESGRYLAVLANQSLHHVVNLEGLFDAVKRSLRPAGLFLVSDMIGRNGHMRWPEALAMVNEFWGRLPARYRANRLLGTTDEQYVNFDCSKAGFEGIRAQDILPLLVQRFGFKVFVPFGNVIDVFVDRGIGPNFDPSNAWDRDFIDRVHAADVEALRAGRIKPTHMVAALSPAPQTQTRHPEMLGPAFCVRTP